MTNTPIADTLRYAAACVLLAAAVAAATCSQPSEADAARATAAQADDAAIDEWLAAARRANPNLTEHEMLRIRAAAIYIQKEQQ